MSKPPISQLLRERLESKGLRFFANDNISQVIKDEDELACLQNEVQEKVQSLLLSLVIDIENDHNTQETARRVAKMLVNETFSGRYKTAPKVTTFVNQGYSGLYVSGPISIRSTCAHHLQNITGSAWVGVVPEESCVIGLSKFNRLVDHIATRPQIQEEMTTQIAHSISNNAKTPNVAVVVKAKHHCITHRGVKEHDSDMTTAVMLGLFEKDSSLKAEFYTILSNMKGINGDH